MQRTKQEGGATHSCRRHKESADGGGMASERSRGRKNRKKKVEMFAPSFGKFDTRQSIKYTSSVLYEIGTVLTDSRLTLGDVLTVGCVLKWIPAH